MELATQQKLLVTLAMNINQQITKDRVKYDVVTDYGKLMELVGLGGAMAAGSVA